MGRIVVVEIVLAAALFATGAATAGPAERLCEDDEILDEVTLRFCTWWTDGVWHFDLTASNAATGIKEVAVACQPTGTTIGQTIIDVYDPGTERTFMAGTLPASESRPSSHCVIEDVEDWTPSTSETPEE